MKGFEILKLSVTLKLKLVTEFIQRLETGEQGENDK